MNYNNFTITKLVRIYIEEIPILKSEILQILQINEEMITLNQN